MNEQTAAAGQSAGESGETQEVGQQSNEIRGDRNSSDRRSGRGGNRHRGGRGQQQQPPQSQPTKNSLNMSELRELAELIAEHGFTDFEFENETIRVRLRKDLPQQQATVISPAQPQTMLSAATQSVQSLAAQPQLAETAAVSNASAPTTTASGAADEDASLRKIISPIVGTFYRAPSPEAEPFVKIGAQVSAETVVCIVEAMKLMNEIPAEMSGEIVKIYVENGQPVEYGQALFAVK